MKGGILLLYKAQNTLKVGLRDILDDRLPEFCRPIKIEGDSISDTLHNDIPLWTPPNPVFIEAPTGSGKTSLIYQELLPRITLSGKNLLIVSNRVALSVQQKQAIMKHFDDPRQSIYTPEGIRRLEDFGQVRVLTYHRLPALLHDRDAKQWLANLEYIIFDEFHFFAADATFNENCNYYLHLATTRFCRAVRIYMSATPWDAIEPVVDAEIHNYHCINYPPQWIPFREGYYYYKKPNYEGIRLHFFERLEDLIPEIERCPQSRWLIFTDSKEKGAELEKRLGKKASRIDAATKGGLLWEKLLSEQRFDTQVLITTAVLDCGINLWDDTLRHVVVMADNRTSLLQMAGRKRLKPGETVNLWVCSPDKHTISMRHRQCGDWLALYQEYDRCVTLEQRKALSQRIWRSGDLSLFKLFSLNKGDLYPNKLARHLIRRRQAFYAKILSGETTFRREVEHWLGVERDKDHTAVMMQRFSLEHGERPLSDEEKEELRDLIVRLYADAGYAEPHTKRNKLHDFRALNNRLEKMELPYKIAAVSGEWVLNKTV